jgi:hypothetical protein
VGQNFPNPYIAESSIPITVVKSSEFDLDLWDLSGKKVKKILERVHLDEGKHMIDITDNIFDISQGSYANEVTAYNGDGVFKSSKMMTLNR